MNNLFFYYQITKTIPMQSNKENNLIVELTFSFALKVIAYTEQLEKDKKYVMATQLLKAGTSIGANVKEAQNAESKSDFIHKMKVAAKEADETEYWLLLCKHSKRYPIEETILQDCESIIKVLSKIISSSKSKVIN
jgi:four helix bundle protein